MKNNQTINVAANGVTLEQGLQALGMDDTPSNRGIVSAMAPGALMAIVTAKLQAQAQAQITAQAQAPSVPEITTAKAAKTYVETVLKPMVESLRITFQGETAQAPVDTSKMNLAQLQAYVAKLQTTPKVSGNAITVAVSVRGAVSVYGMGRNPTTLYAAQWVRFLSLGGFDASKHPVMAFIAKHSKEIEAQTVFAAQPHISAILKLAYSE